MPPDQDEAEFGRALRSERLRLHAQVLPLALLGSAVLALVVAGALWGKVAHSLVLGWLACVAFALAFRALAYLAGSEAADDTAAARSLRLHRLAFAVHGLAWMLGGALIWAPGAADQTDLVVLAAAAVVGGALISTAFDIVATSWFVAPAVLPLLLHQVQRLAGVPTAGDLIAGLFVLTVTLAVLRSQRGTRRSVAAQLAATQRAEESRRSAELLADKHQLLEQLLRTTRQGFWFVDKAGVTTDVNPAMCELLGRPRAELVCHAAQEFLGAEAFAIWQAQREAATRTSPTEVVPGCEIELHHHHDGRVVVGWVTATTLTDTLGKSTGSVSIWTDISARRADELKLRTYEVMANSIADMVSVVDEGLVYRVVNDAWCRATGMSREQAVGSSIDAVPVPAAAEERRRALRECLERQEMRRVRSAIDRPGALRRFFETTYFPYADAIAGMRCAVLISRDVSEQERAREALAETAAYLDRTLNATGEAIFASDATEKTQRLRFCNQQMLRMWGIPLELAGELTHRLLEKYIAPQLVDSRKQARIVARVVATNTHHESEVRLKDGRVLFQRCTPSRAGEKPLRVWSFRDITAEVHALEAAQARDAEQRALLEAFPGFIARLDAGLRYTFANDRMLALMGMTREAVIGRSVRDLPGLTWPEQARRCHERALAGEVVVVERHYPVCPHRPASDVQITYAPGADHTGKARVVYAFAIDITPLKRTEAALLAAKDEAERANRAKSQFLSQMSHELRTPLNAILGFGQLLELPSQPALPGTQRAYVAEILRGARHLLELINQVLDLGSVEAGRLQLRPQPVSLVELGDECLSLVRPLAADREVRLPAAGALAAPWPVQADRTRLKQVLLNLLGNAIKYNQRGGEVELAAEVRGERVRIHVHDSGPGLDPAQQRRLFEPFERLGADRSAVEGTGIGLALSRGLMLAMGGEIGVSSAPGQGSTFWVELPRATQNDDGERETNEPPVAPLVDSGATCTVLCIEDNPVSAAVLQAMLERLPGLVVVLAADPWEGLERAAHARPALVLTDIQLPDIDGFEVLRRLRADAATRHIPVVAVSANAMPDDLASGLAAGFDDYLSKPFEMAALHKAVLRLLERTGVASGPVG